MIDYSKIAAAINYYSDNGFKYIEVPWTVPRQTMEITAPASFVIESDFGCLVGSAEQSFLQMIIDKKLHPGNYVACSPCWRKDVLDEFHRPYFMKVELISIGFHRMDVNEMIEICSGFFAKYAMIKVEKTDIGFDIVNYKGIELGSYGTRASSQTGPWTYGTGCAEPRLTSAIRK